MNDKQDIKRMTLRLSIDLHRWLLNYSHKLKQSMHETILDLIRYKEIEEKISSESHKTTDK